jgi:hypothetical protein
MRVQCSARQQDQSPTRYAYIVSGVDMAEVGDSGAQTPAAEEKTRVRKAYKYRPPAWVRDDSIGVQNPEGETFDVKSLSWAVVQEKSWRFKVPCAPTGEVPRYLQGENARGGTSVHCTDKCKKTESLLMDKRAVCMYGHLTGKRQKALLNANVLQDKEPGKRLSKFARGESQKQGCEFHFTMKEYREKPGQVYIRFACPNDLDENQASLYSMQHVKLVNGEPVAAHAGRLAPLQRTACRVPGEQAIKDFERQWTEVSAAIFRDIRDAAPASKGIMMEQMQSLLTQICNTRATRDGAVFASCSEIEEQDSKRFKRMRSDGAA